MPFRKPIRILILAFIAIGLAVALRGHFRGPTPIVEEDALEVPMRVARDVSPTIVEPNENWLETPTDTSEPANLPDSHSAVLLPAEPSTRAHLAPTLNR